MSFCDIHLLSYFFFPNLPDRLIKNRCLYASAGNRGHGYSCGLFRKLTWNLRSSLSVTGFASYSTPCIIFCNFFERRNRIKEATPDMMTNTIKKSYMVAIW